MSDNKDIKYGLTDEDYTERLKKVDENMEARKQARQQPKPKKVLKTAGKPLAILGLIVVLIAALIFSLSSYFIVDSIKVEGNKYFTDEEIVAMSHAKPGKNIIYNLGSSSIKKYLTENPYIAEVNVNRKLPSTIEINVQERQQVLAVTYSDEYLILDKEGILLRKTSTEPKITIVSGLKTKRITLGEKLVTTDDVIFGNALKIVNMMKEKDLYFTRLEMSDLYIKAYILDNLVCTGTTSQITSAMESGRLHTILETLFEKSIRRGTISISDDGYASYQPAV